MLYGGSMTTRSTLLSGIRFIPSKQSSLYILLSISLILHTPKESLLCIQHTFYHSMRNVRHFFLYELTSIFLGILYNCYAIIFTRLPYLHIEFVYKMEDGVYLFDTDRHAQLMELIHRVLLGLFFAIHPHHPLLSI